jgi:hypothetical protein
LVLAVLVLAVCQQGLTVLIRYLALLPLLAAVVELLNTALQTLAALAAVSLGLVWSALATLHQSLQVRVIAGGPKTPELAAVVVVVLVALAVIRHPITAEMVVSGLLRQ